MAGFFDENDIIKPVAPVQKKQAGFFDAEDVISPAAPIAAASGSSFFDEEDKVSSGTSPTDTVQASPVPQDSEYAQVRKTIDRPYLDAPIVSSETTSDKELEAIARHHGIDPNVLKAKAETFGALREGGKGNTFKEIGSSVSRGALLNAPQFAMKKAESDPKMRAAIDDLQALANSKRSFGRGIAEGATGLAVPIGAVGQGASMLTKVAAGAGLGAAVGLSNSREGQEASGTAMGAGLGGALGAATHGIGRFFSSRGANKAEQALIQEVDDTYKLDVGAKSQQAQKEFGKSETLLADQILSDNPRGLSPDDVSAIVKEQYTPDELLSLLSNKGLEGKTLAAEATSRGVTTEQQLAAELMTSRAESLASELTSGSSKPVGYEKALAVIKDQENRQGKEFVQQTYTRMVDSENTARILAREPSHVGSISQGVTGSIQRKLGGVQFLFRHIDDNFNVGARDALSEFSRDTNRATFAKGAFRRDMNTLFKTLEDEGLATLSKNAASVIQKFEDRGMQALTNQEQRVIKLYKTYTDKVRDFAVKGVTEFEGGRLSPLAVPDAGPNYVTRTVLDIPTMMLKVEKALDQAASDAGKLVGKPIKHIGQLEPAEYALALERLPSFSDLVEFNSWKDSVKLPPKSAPELYNSIRSSIGSPDGNIALQKQARFAKERIGNVPNLIRETDLMRLASSYTNDLVDTVYKRRGIGKLRDISRKLEKIGADVEAKYVDNIIQDSLGIREGTFVSGQRNTARDFSLYLQRWADKADSPIKKYAIESIEALVIEGLPALARQLYPNVLGASARAVFQNLTYGLARTAPELGGIYGYTTYVRSIAKVLRNPTTFKTQLAQAHKLGYMPEEFVKPAEVALAKGLMSSSAWRMSANKLDAMSKLAMSAFQASESLNRVSIINTAETMAGDLVKHNLAALKSLKNFPKDLRKTVLQHVTAGDAGAISELIGKHLNDVTAFNYNRQSMFELGRELGPLFSTFAKWPTEMLGEVLYEIQAKGKLKAAGRMTEKLMLPFIGLYAANLMIQKAAGIKDNDSDRYKKTFGASGLSQAAPVNALSGVAKGDIFTPPVIKSVMQGIVTPIASGEGPKILKGLDSVAFQFIPGAWLLRFIGDDMATYISGTRPEGTTGTERVIEGTRKLTK